MIRANSETVDGDLEASTAAIPTDVWDRIRRLRIAWSCHYSAADL
jgi:hypothetical protein